MPELLDFDHHCEFAPGDVLMVERKMRDKETGKRWVWRFFLVVTKHAKWSDIIGGCVVGNEKLKGKRYQVDTDDERNTVYYLDPSEWPDGIHAFRMALIMQRKVEID